MILRQRTVTRAEWEKDQPWKHFLVVFTLENFFKISKANVPVVYCDLVLLMWLIYLFPFIKLEQNHITCIIFINICYINVILILCIHYLISNQTLGEQA